jgi:NRPS condensation-like uncharacterized protein
MNYIYAINFQQTDSLTKKWQNLTSVGLSRVNVGRVQVEILFFLTHAGDERDVWRYPRNAININGRGGGCCLSAPLNIFK